MRQKFLLLFMGLWTSISMLAYNGGTGTEIDPYLISSETDLAALTDAVNSGTDYRYVHFLLTQDLTEITTIVGEDGDHPFSGVFDGNGHTLTVNISANGSYAGVFGYAKYATIKNLGVKGSVRLEAAGTAYAGGICGALTHGSIIGCYNTAVISASSSGGGAYAGGISGSYISHPNYVATSSITNCYNTGAISSSPAPNEYGSFSGGICGEIFSYASVNNCYNTGAIVAPTDNRGFNSGGICGAANYSSEIKNCFAANASVTGGQAGRVAGAIDTDAPPTLTNNYALANMSITYHEISNSQVYTITVSSADATGLEGKDMDNASFQSSTWLKDVGNLAWDFDAVWRIPKNGGFPGLQMHYHELAGTIEMTLPEITYGDLITLSATSNNPDVPIVYSSSDPTVADISGNQLTALKPGPVTITASQDESEGFSAGSKAVSVTVGRAPLAIASAAETGGVSGQANSTGIDFTLDRSITGLLAEHITIANGTGQAVKGDLSGANDTYAIALANVVKEGTVNVIVDHPNYVVANASVSVWTALHTVTVVSAGSNPSGASSYLLDETVTIDAGATPSGQRFTRWTATPTVKFAQATAPVTSFKMPAADVTVTANFAPLYAIRIASMENGKVTAESSPAIAGERVTLRIAPENGYALTEIGVRLTATPNTPIALSGEGDTRTFVMPDGAVTVSASFHKTADRLALDEAVERLKAAEFVVDQETLNTEEAALAWLMDALNDLLTDLNIAVPERNVWMYNFTAAVAGTKTLPLGRDGKFAATVSISKNGNYATEYVYGTIKATRYVWPVGIDTPQAGGLKAYVSNGLLHVSGLAAGGAWSVYDASGRLVYQQIAGGEAANVPLAVRGLYIVQIGDRSVKVLY
jgi:hypothetical protein